MRRFLLPVGVSLVFVASAPFIGQIRDVLRQALGDRFALVMGAVLVVTVVAVVVGTARRIREHRLRRFGLIALGVAVFVGYVSVMSTGNAEVDAVERVHFLQYGLVAVLFYRAMPQEILGRRVAVAMVAGMLVGIGEEWLQWLVPTRVGDVRDVALNAFALGSGVLIATGLYPPTRPSWRIQAAHWPGLLRLGAAGVAAFAGFFHSAHLGYEITDPDIGRFRSFYTAGELDEVAADRAVRWRTDPPTSLEPLAIQDHYLVEAASHVLHRNDFYARGRFRISWLENAILERYYEPVLGQRSMSSGAPFRWPPEQRAEVEAKGAAADGPPYVSPVNMDRVFIAPTKPQLWLAAAAMVGALLAAAAALERRDAAEAASGEART